MKILLVAINAKYIHSNPAIHSLKASLTDYSDNVEIVEYAINQQNQDILSDIYKHKADVIAFSCYIWNIKIVMNLIHELPKILDCVDIWLGGPEVSFNAKELLTQEKNIKGIMIGEGEQTFNELVYYYSNNNILNNLPSISGIAYRDNDSIVITNPRELSNLDDIPFFYNDLKKFENKIIYYESSRGCPFRCSYCLSSIDKTVRLRSLSKVLHELQFFLDNKVPQVKFIDRTFNCNKEHATSIWNYLLEHDNGITNFHFEISADLITDEELNIIKKMRPGLIQLEIGVQSTNPDTIIEIRRHMNLDRLKNVVATINSFNNTHQHLDLIAGLPYEDLTSFINSFNDVYAMKPNQLQLGFLKVLKGSYMEEMIESYNLKFLQNPPYEVLSTKWLSYSDILQLKSIEEMVELYYNSGQFTNTISYLQGIYNSPYDMFLALSTDYISNGYDLRKPARSYRYEMLYNFVSIADFENIEIYKELLTLDIYLRENCKVRPSFAKDLSLYKKEIYARESNRANHIEVFNYIHFNNGNFEISKNHSDLQYIEFDYFNRNPLNNNANILVKK